MPVPASEEECQFFHKVGSCRHGNKCVRKHTIPSESKAIILVSMPLPLRHGRPTNSMDALEKTIENIFVEIALMAPIQEIVVASNDSPHISGNVYISFANASDAAGVLTNINARWFNERPIFATYLPSQNPSFAVCREGSSCQRKLDCNYVHPLVVNEDLWRKLFTAQARSKELPV